MGLSVRAMMREEEGGGNKMVPLIAGDVGHGLQGWRLAGVNVSREGNNIETTSRLARRVAAHSWQQQHLKKRSLSSVAKKP